MTTLPTPKFFYFDLGNVLLSFDHEIAIKRVAALTGLSTDRVRELIFQSDLQLSYERGELTTDQFFASFCQAGNVRPARSEILHALSAIFRPNAPVIPIVSQLRAAGHPMGILSNTCDAHWSYIVNRRYGFIERSFNVHVLSFEVGADKPKPTIYEAAAELSGAAPEEIFFVDDRWENVTGARACGFDAVHYRSAGDLIQELVARRVPWNL